jgi:hypothetical protein
VSSAVRGLGSAYFCILAHDSGALEASGSLYIMALLTVDQWNHT